MEKQDGWFTGLTGLVGIAGELLMKRLLQDRPVWMLAVWFMILVSAWSIRAFDLTPWLWFVPGLGALALALSIVYKRSAERKQMSKPHHDMEAWEVVNYLLDETDVGLVHDWNGILSLLRKTLQNKPKKLWAWGWNLSSECKRVESELLFDSVIEVLPTGGSCIGNEEGMLLENIHFNGDQIRREWKLSKRLDRQIIKPDLSKWIRGWKWMVIQARQRAAANPEMNGDAIMGWLHTNHNRSYWKFLDHVSLKSFPDEHKISAIEAVQWIESKIALLEGEWKIRIINAPDYSPKTPGRFQAHASRG